MSILPQYTREIQDVEETHPLFNKGDLDLEAVPSEPISSTYPPRLGEASATGTGTGPRRPNVTYIWNPQFPVKGNREEVLGVFSASKDVG